MTQKSIQPYTDLCNITRKRTQHNKSKFRTIWELEYPKSQTYKSEQYFSDQYLFYVIKLRALHKELNVCTIVRQLQQRWDPK